MPNAPPHQSKIDRSFDLFLRRLHPPLLAPIAGVPFPSSVSCFVSAPELLDIVEDRMPLAEERYPMERHHPCSLQGCYRPVSRGGHGTDYTDSTITGRW